MIKNNRYYSADTVKKYLTERGYLTNEGWETEEGKAFSDSID